MKTYKMKFYKAPYGILYLSLSAILLVTLTAFFILLLNPLSAISSCIGGIMVGTGSLCAGFAQAYHLTVDEEQICVKNGIFKYSHKFPVQNISRIRFSKLFLGGIRISITQNLDGINATDEYPLYLVDKHDVKKMMEDISAKGIPVL